MQWLPLATSANTECWYRYNSVSTSNGYIDEWGEFCRSGPPSVKVELEELPVAKKTKKGVRLVGGRFVLRDSRKRFACPTISEAQDSFIARKEKQIKILQEQLRQAKIALQIMQGMKERRIETRKFLDQVLDQSA